MSDFDPSVTICGARVVAEAATFEPGWVRFRGPTIEAVGPGEPDPGSADRTDDLGMATIAPGFVDMHAHGGGGASFAEGAAAARRVAETHRAHGTTSIMASLVTDSVDALELQLRALAPLVAAGELLGIHLEGPWLSDRHCGAHEPALLRDPLPGDVELLLAAGRGAITMVTLAVERAGGLEACRYLCAHGVRVALGHSAATYAQAQAAIDCGASIATHLFNAERGLHHREPGLILALLEREHVTLELIADGVHLHPGILHGVSMRAPGRVALVTDAIGAAGCGDGAYALGPMSVQVRDGVARLGDRDVLAGSTLTLDRAVATAVGAGIPLRAAIDAATVVPARACGRADIGRLAPGCRADAVVLDAGLSVAGVIHGGAWLGAARRPLSGSGAS